jgi:ABC-2 type transport system permease protein
MTSQPVTLTLPPVADPGARPGMLRVYGLECWYEFLKMLRLPIYAISTLGFPVMFYLLFGVAMSRGADEGRVAVYLLGSYSVFGVISAALFGFGVGVAADRSMGWMQLKQAVPMPPGAFLAARTVSCAIFGILIVTLMALCGTLLAGVSLPAGAWVRLLAVVVLGCVPFCLIGLTIGYLVKPHAAPAIVNIINLPLSFASGLWLPVEMLPNAMQRLAPWLPPYHLGRLAWQSLGVADASTAPRHVLMLLLTAVVAGIAARWAYRRGASQELW